MTLNKIKKFGLGLSAFLAVVSLFISPSLALANAPHVTADLAGTNNDDPNDGWSKNVNVNTGQKVKFQLDIHNTEVGTTSINVQAKVALPSSTGDAVATVTTDNAGSAQSTTHVNVNGGGQLQYIPGTTQISWDRDGDGVKEFNNTGYQDGITGDGISFGAQNGCNAYIITVTFLAQVVGGNTGGSESHLNVVKFNDRNGNGTQDSGEEGLPWNFAVQGPNDNDFNMTTGGDGKASKTVTVPGSYVITEESKSGWTATRGVSQTVTIAAGETKEVVFGNKQNEGTATPPVTTGGGQSQSQTQTQNNNQTQNVTVTNNNSTPAVLAASVPTKLPATGPDVLGLATMAGAAPLGVMLSRYGRGRLTLKKKDEDLNSIANGLVQSRNAQA